MLTLRTSYVAVFLLTIVSSISVANGATQKWTYTIPEGAPNTYIPYVVVDESGGVVLLWEDDQNRQQGVIWLDAAGKELYRGQPYPSDASSLIIGAKRRGVLYTQASGTYIVVSRDGSETTLQGNYAFQFPNSFVDRCGFFVRSDDGKSITRYDF